MNEIKDVWAITSYYNPLGYSNRLQNYRKFRRHLALRLCTVEHSLNGSYELEYDDAELMIRICSRDVLWQKERLLNLAMHKLPNDAKFIVWLDCDVVFGNQDWFYDLSRMLPDLPILQCFSELVDLEQGIEPDQYIGTKAPANGLSVAWMADAQMIALGSEHLTTTDTMRNASPGGAWAARRGLLQSHGLYDAMILGGADRLYAYACLGRFDDAIQIARLHGVRAKHYLDWAQPLFDAVNGRIGVIKGQLLHLWHGKLSNRRYLSRHLALSGVNFDPYNDIELDESGAWRWSACASSELRELAVSYFEARLEDGPGAGHNTVN